MLQEAPLLSAGDLLILRGRPCDVAGDMPSYGETDVSRGTGLPPSRKRARRAGPPTAGSATS